MGEAKQSTFQSAADIAREKKVPVHPRVESVLTVCKLCGKDAEPVCWDCLDATVENAIERMAKNGQLDEAIERVIKKRQGGSP